MDQNILRRSERLKKTRDISITDENMDKSSRAPSQRSGRTIISKSSIASLKRLAEARAARELAELEKERIERLRQLEDERLTAERSVIEARLAEERVRIEVGNDEDSDHDNRDHQVASTSRSKIQEWIDGSVLVQTHAPANDDYVAREDKSTDIENLTRAITDAIKRTSSPTHRVSSGDKMLSRLSARDLPVFSGDPIDWLKFKHAFETTTRIGHYSDEENVARLQRCLQGAAWEAVAARLITVTSASEIMKTLELRFGRPELVMNKLIMEIRKIPKLTGSRSELIVLSTKVANCVAAIKATNVNYLYSHDLISDIVNKLTENLVYRWVDYCAKDTDHPRLSALADFLMREAERICQAGAVEVTPLIKTKNYVSGQRTMLTAIAAHDDSVNIFTAEKGKQMKCLYCDIDGHMMDDCSVFRNMDISERWKWVCSRKLCFKCLSPKHRRERCRTKKQCKVCKRGHHSLLHRLDWLNKLDTAPSNSSPPETTNNTWTNTLQSKRVFLKVLPVIIEGSSGLIETFALLDEGSTVSLLDSSIADKVGADGPAIDLSIQGAIGGKNKLKSRVVSLTLRTSVGSYVLDNVRTVDNLSLPIQHIDYQILEHYSHLQGINLQPFVGQPTLLIGQDYWHLIVSREIRQGRMNEPVASRTLMGWVIHGYVSSITRDIPELSCHVRETNADEDLHELVKEYFRIESIGVKYSNRDNDKHTRDEERALHILDTKSNKVDDRWEAGLLWRSDDVKLPDNKKNALQRLMIIERMMDNDPSFALDYMKQINTMLESGYAEEVKEVITGDRIWYLPHFGVRNPNKPGKLRVVFDARAETKGISLNTELLAGPDLLNSLVGVLLRFRERAVAVSGDIKEMFLRVKIIEEDQKSQMFLWRGLDRSGPPREYKMTSMTFGAKSSPCTATYILRRNADMFHETHPRAVLAIKERHYVDDYLDSVDTEEEMKQLIADVTNIHRSGGFVIRGFMTNKPSCLPDGLEKDTVNLLEGSTVQRTLGMIWRPQTDQLGFDLSLKKLNTEVAAGIKKPTKREMLKVIMSIFDPLGFLSPFLIRGKILLQDVWRSGVQWDEEVGEKFAKIWFNWLQDLKACQNFYVRRCYSFSQLDVFQLHVFVDASEQAYAAVGYLRRENGEIAFIASKSRVAPLKTTTVPRLELQSALIGARLGTMIQKELDLSIVRRFFWTDSRAVWHWIQNETSNKNTFISNRLSEIRDLTKPEEWRWLPGHLNVADEATRARGRAESFWIMGPNFLRHNKSDWPRIAPSMPIERENVLIIHTWTDYTLPAIDRFSQWLRLIRSTAYVLLFIDRLKTKTPVRLNSSYLNRAEKLWIIQSQHDSFSQDLLNIQNNSPLPKDSRLKHLSPYMRDGVLRLKGRANVVRNVDMNMLDPVILDGRHQYSRLLTMHYHIKAYHGSTEAVVNQMRMKYWVINLRSTVKFIQLTCQFCKIRKSQPLQPTTGNLPLARLAHHSRPFTHCGVDYFGPMVVTIGRRREKRYGALFTCMTTRAIHIELAGSLTSDSTIMAMRRMMSRRGCPSIMYSDNGTNFRGADEELKKVIRELDEEEISTFLTNKRIEWRFNPPLAPHMGGCWERMIRSVKRSLAIVLKEQAPKEEVLLTTLAEIEHTINSRPLTHVSASPDDPDALTPNHFLLGGQSEVPWLGSCEAVSRKGWRDAQRLADMFWKRWIREYLPTLLPRSPHGRNVDLKEGSLVVLVDPTLPRNVWPKGVISKLYPGRDGVTRVADIRTVGGILKRPLTRLIPLLTEV